MSFPGPSRALRRPYGAVLAIAAALRLGADCTPIRTFADGRSPLREIFVATTGDNTTGNGSVAKPFRTLARAVQGVKAGDAIRLLPGTYAAGTLLQNFAGTSNAPIWIGGIDGQAVPVIQAGNEALHLTRLRYVVIENLEVSGSQANGINCDDGGDYADPTATHHLVFRRLHIHHIGTGGNNDGLKLSGLNEYHVLDCQFEAMSAGGSGIDHVGCHRGVIAGCTFTDAGANSIQCKGGSEDIEIHGNRFVNGGARAINVGGSTGFPFFRPPLSTTAPNYEARNIRVVANLFRGSEAPIAFVGAVDSSVANNTFVEPTKWVMRILQETVSSGGYTFGACASNRFVNNLVWFDRNRVSVFANVGPNTAAATFQFANNLWYAFNQPNRSQPSLPSAETGGLYGLDPLFVAAAGGDYSLRTNSPAAGKGKTPPSPGMDLAGNCYAAIPSVGAFEARPRTPEQVDSDGDRLPDFWEAQHNLDPEDANDAALDLDGDRVSNYGEFLTATDPRDPGSVFLLRPPLLDAGQFLFRFPTVAGRVYRVQSRPTVESPWLDRTVATGTGAELEYRHESLASSAEWFRVRVE